MPVSEADLPVVLPDVLKYEPTGTGESPLAAIPDFVNTRCPVCGGPAKRETDTMGGFACSSWYFLQFTDPHNASEPFSQEAVRKWLPVKLYVGGAEHAVMHLLYARFWTKVLMDAGYIGFSEPFLQLRNQGMLLAYTAGRKVGAAEAIEAGEESGTDEPIEDWKVLRPDERERTAESERVYRWVKMSKSLYNVVTPDEMAEKYGADSLRLYTVFVAPFEDTVQWTDKGIEGANRFLNCMWRLWGDLRPYYNAAWRSMPALDLSEAERGLRRKLHQTIRKVGEDLESFRFNTCVAALMEFTNELSLYRNQLAHTSGNATATRLISEIVETLPLIMSPMTPHLSDEMWERLGKAGVTYREHWPEFDADAAAEDVVTIVVQVNGKVRDKLVMPVDTPQDEIERLALQCEKVARGLCSGKALHKTIVVPGKLINFVIG